MITKKYILQFFFDTQFQFWYKLTRRNLNHLHLQQTWPQNVYSEIFSWVKFWVQALGVISLHMLKGHGMHGDFLFSAMCALWTGVVRKWIVEGRVQCHSELHLHRTHTQVQPDWYSSVRWRHLVQQVFWGPIQMHLDYQFLGDVLWDHISSTWMRGHVQL